ncbi:MAG: hypothetical protein KME45_26725 [Stenomitos rutilans HA7619-LM2]|jgi:hypothetical protein|nr:hypothetical protein [Stenomitos rutilans HA7619-LM2]
MQEPLFLDVPFQEKEQAKHLGARWHPDRKKWYVPEGMDKNRFRRWLAVEPSVALMPPLWLVEAPQRHPPQWMGCVQCGFDDNQCYTLAASGGHDESKPWQPRLTNELVVLRWMDAPPEAIAAAITRQAKGYFPDRSKQMGMRCYVNHCQQCGMSLYESYLGDRLAPFLAETRDWASRIRLYQLPIAEPVRVECSYIAGAAVSLLAEHAQRLLLPEPARLQP